MPSHLNHSNELNTFTPLNITVQKKYIACLVNLMNFLSDEIPRFMSTSLRTPKRKHWWFNGQVLVAGAPHNGEGNRTGKERGDSKTFFWGLRVNISRWEITFSFGAGAMLQECGKGNPGSRIVSVWHLLSSYFWDVANLEIHTGNSHLGFPIRLL